MSDVATVTPVLTGHFICVASVGCLGHFNTACAFVLWFVTEELLCGLFKSMKYCLRSAAAYYSLLLVVVYCKVFELCFCRIVSCVCVVGVVFIGGA